MSRTLTAAERAEILAACERLSLDYSHYADLGQMETWSQLFAEDAELVVRGASTKGRAAILKSVSGPRGQVRSIHAINNLRIDVLGPDEATGVVYITAYMAPKADGVAAMAQIAPAAVGEYRDVYRKTADGWRFARREFVPLVLA
jgi:ketosteroid isomerase-like protein